MGADENSRQNSGSAGAAEFDFSGVELDEKYRIIELIGEGAGSKVYLAEHKMLSGQVAIKVLKEEKLQDQISRERFKREAKLAMQLSHPNIVEIRGYGVSPTGEPFIIMELCTGSTLEELLHGTTKTQAAAQQSQQTQPLPPQVFLSISEQLASALTHAHNKGIIHRDIKPANILILQNNRPHSSTSRARLHIKLLDFGLAKNFAAGSTATGNGAPSSSDTTNPPSSTAADLTMGTAIIGTPNYMSPEQCLNKPLDARSDIYSLCCVLFECATGRQPFAAGSDLAVMNNHLHQTPTFEKSDKVPDDIKEIILRGLSKDPQARFQSAAELSAALQKASFESNKAKFSVIIITAVAVTALCVLAASAYLNYGHNRKLNSADAAIKQKEKSKLDRLGTIQMDAEEMNEAGHSAKRDHPSLGSDYDKAEQLFIASRRLAVSQGKKFIAAKDSLDLGFTYIENHKLDKAEEPLVTALREFQPLEPSITLSHQIANCYLGLGNLRKFQGRPEEAYAYHKKASEIWPAEEHERKYSVTLRLLEDLIDLQKYDEAKKFGNQVLKDLGPIEDSEKPLYREKVWTQVMMAELDLTTNDETSANQRIDDLLAISQHEKNYGYTIDSMFNLARKATNQHRYRLALKILDKSKLYIGSRDHDKKRWDRAKKMTELVYAKMENSSDKSHSRLHRIGSLSPEDLLHRALSYRAKHEYRDALDLMEEAKEAARLRKDFQAENMIKYEIANTFQKLAMDPKADEELKREGNVSNIISIYNDVLEQRKQLGYNENTSKIYWQLGVIYLKQRKLDKAITTLQLAVKTAKDAESPNDWIMGDIELLQAYVDKNDIKHAFETGEELKKLIDEFGLPKENNWIQIRSTMVLASLHLNHGSPTKAMEEVENLISIFRTIPTNEIPARACAELAVNAVARKQYKMAKKLADYILSRPGLQENESIPIAQSVVKVLKEKGSY